MQESDRKSLDWIISQPIFPKYFNNPTPAEVFNEILEEYNKK